VAFIITDYYDVIEKKEKRIGRRVIILILYVHAYMCVDARMFGYMYVCVRVIACMYI
jgi:hypothetical protein